MVRRLTPTRAQVWAIDSVCVSMLGSSAQMYRQNCPPRVESPAADRGRVPDRIARQTPCSIEFSQVARWREVGLAAHSGAGDESQQSTGSSYGTSDHP